MANFPIMKEHFLTKFKNYFPKRWPNFVKVKNNFEKAKNKFRKIEKNNLIVY